MKLVKFVLGTGKFRSDFFRSMFCVDFYIVLYFTKIVKIKACDEIIINVLGMIFNEKKRMMCYYIYVILYTEIILK